VIARDNRAGRNLFVTLDAILQTYMTSTAAEWHQLHAPLVPGTHAHECLWVYKPDVSIVVGEGLSGENSEYVWEWVQIYPDRSARKFYIDVFYNGVPVYREFAVSVDGSRADLPSPSGYVDDNDAAQGWRVERDEYAFVRQFSVIRGREQEFDQKFSQAERAANFHIL